MLDKNFCILHTYVVNIMGSDVLASGDARSQGTSNHDIDYVEPEWIGLHMLMLR